MRAAGRWRRALPVLLALLGGLGAGCATSARVRAVHDEAAATLRFTIDGREACVYQHASRFAIPHVWPLRSPAGRPLTVQRTEPFPHHRSLWIVDRVQLEDGPITDFYHEWKNLRDADRPELGHHSFIRHDRFTEVRSGDRAASATAELSWIIEDDVPVLAQTLRCDVEDLGAGEYLLELCWELRADHGDVTFHSDQVHYAWPYLRMDPSFSGEQGGAITDDSGRRGQADTHEQYARWIDYSNTVDGVTEGLAVLLPDDGRPRQWLTREYGTFGPRRPDAWSGTGFTLKRGEAIGGRVAILVHRGDATGGRVRDRYEAWLEGVTGAR